VEENEKEGKLCYFSKKALKKEFFSLWSKNRRN
jgi:hypothetical protein